MHKSAARLFPQMKYCKLLNTFRQNQNVYNFSQSTKINDISGDFLQFPRELTGLNIKFNWMLAKNLITPFNLVSHNQAKPSQGGPSGTKNEVKATGKGGFDLARFKIIHRNIAKHLSALENLFVEDGELGGLHVRMILSNEKDAAIARSILNGVKEGDFSNNVTVIFGNDKELDNKTLVDVGSNLILTSNLNKDTLSEGIKLIFEKKP